MDDADLVDLPESGRRYLEAAIAPDSPRIRSVRIEMRGHIRLRSRWMSFRARQVLTPHLGSVWAARVAGTISGSDHYADGSGGMHWKLLGVATVMKADGPDISRSSAERAGLESVWVPTALLPHFGVSWEAVDDDHIAAHTAVDGRPIDLRLTVSAEGRPRSVATERWGDPDETGHFGRHPFGADFSRFSTFGSLTIPVAGEVGWFHGTDRWSDGAFFRYEITDLEAVEE